MIAQELRGLRQPLGIDHFLRITATTADIFQLRRVPAVDDLRETAVGSSKFD